MKVIATLLLIVAVNFTAICQSTFQTSVLGKIWKSNEIYSDNELIEDTLYVVFDPSGEFISGEVVEDVLGGSSARTVPSPDSFIINDSGSTSSGKTLPPSIIISDGYDDVEYEVIYYDEDDLVLQRNDTIPGEYFEDSLAYIYNLEFRFILEN